MIDIIVAIFFIGLVIFLAVPTIYGFSIGAPILYSPRRATEKALDFLQVKAGEKFYELGMGNGRVMVVAAKKFGLQTTGFELSPVLVAIAWLNLQLRGIRNFRLRMKNFYKEDLSQADVVFCFLTPKAMRKLKTKFEKELRPGTRIISYAFSIKGWEPVKIIHEDTPGKVFIYEIGA